MAKTYNQLDLDELRTLFRLVPAVGPPDEPREQDVPVLRLERHVDRGAQEAAGLRRLPEQVGVAVTGCT